MLYNADPMHSARNLDARGLDALYDEGYYHGTNSGYPVAGYESAHASWRHWVEHLATSHRGRWLDLGCAYGFLVGEARAGGFDAVGVDVSAYALSRASIDTPDACGRLTRSCIETLPFADETFDVVSAFDVLEHLVDPARALPEIRRVLRPGGVLVGATPDPLFFDGQEETHFSEYPPSYWIDALIRLGFSVDFRFFQADYNLELRAVRTGEPRVDGAEVLHPEGFGTQGDIGTVGGVEAGRVGVRLRAGFGTAERHEPAPTRWLEAGEGRAYVVVTGRDPVALGGALVVRSAGGPADVTVAMDDQRLVGCTVGEGWHEIPFAPMPVAAGGHHVRIRTTGSLFVRELTLQAEPATRASLVSRLPFDMYQRYDQVRAVLDTLPEPPRSLLDVGGALGGPGGHLAASGDFFPECDVRSIDARALDHPDHRAATGTALPFGDNSFDGVICLDVLEHVPATERVALLGELTRVARRYVLLAAPFATPGVAAADAELFALIQARHGYAHAFLDEHLGYGHPDLTTTATFFRAAGASVVVLPNGYLPYWSLMQALNLPLAEPAMGSRYAAAQACYNGLVPDWHEPAYRHLLVVDLDGDMGWCPAVRDLAVDGPDAGTAATAMNQILDLAVSGGARVQAADGVARQIPPPLVASDPPPVAVPDPPPRSTLVARAYALVRGLVRG